MRRKDKEIKDIKEIESIMNKSNVCRIALSENPCDWDIKYSSVIGFGKAFFIHDFDEKIKALNIIIEHYSESSYEFQKKIIDTVTIIKVEIENITGKRSGY